MTHFCRILLFIFGVSSCLPRVFSQSSTHVIESNNSAGVNIRSFPRIQNGNVIATLPSGSKLVSTDIECDPNNTNNASEWYQVDLPSSTGSNTVGYMVKASYLAQADCNNLYIRVNSTASNGLRIRTGAGTIFPIAKIGGSDAKVWPRDYFVVAGLQLVSGTIWYQIFLPNNVVDANGRTINYGWVSGAYVTLDSNGSSASLSVNIQPSGARTAGAEWNLDNDCWKSSGTRLSDLCPDSYTIYPKQVPGYIAPPPQSISLSSGQSRSRTLTYTPINVNGSVSVTINPSGARNDGARWRLDNGPWRTSGYTESNVTPGSHNVQFYSIANWISPSTQNFQLTTGQSLNLTGTYTQQTGSVQVNITPSGAQTAGAQWNLNGGPWQSSGYIISGITPGNYIINFRSVANWSTPNSRSIVVSPNQTTIVSGQYTAIPQNGTVSYTLHPQLVLSRNPQWRIDGGTWLNSNQTANNILPGNHTIEFKTISGWTTPVSQSINLLSGQNYLGIASYGYGPVQGPLTEAEARGTGFYSGHGLDPVNLATGAAILGYQDIKIPGVGTSLVWNRFYNSRNTGYQRHLGRGWTHSYDIHISFSSLEWTVHYGDSHQESYIPYPDGSTIPKTNSIYQTLLRNSNNTYTLTFPDGAKYYFDAVGKCISVEDRNGHSVTLNYNGTNLVSVIAPGGRSLQISYDSQNRIKSIIDPANQTIEYGYNSANDLIYVINLRKDTTFFSYDSQGQILTLIDPRGNLVVQNTYDNQNRVIKQVNALFDTTTIEYNNSSILETILIQPNGSRKYYYHINYGLIEEQNERRYSRFYFYDQKQNLIRRQTPLGRQHHYTYNDDGVVTSYINPLYDTTSIVYDTQNNPTTIYNAKHDSIIQNFDNHNNLILRRLPNSATIRFGYTNNLLSSVHTPLGDSIHLKRNSHGDVIRVESILGFTEFSYDPLGRPTSVQDLNGNLTSYSYDEHGNISSVTDALLQSEYYSYDPNGNLVQFINKRGDTTKYVYDPQDRLITIIDPYKSEIKFIYDSNNNLIQYIDANGNSVTFGYDIRNLLTSRTDSLGTWGYAYDRDENLSFIANPVGNSVNISYDFVGQPVTINTSSGSTTRFTYDALGLVNKVIDPLNGITHYQRDALGQILKVNMPNGDSVQYEYDLGGNVTKITDQEGYISELLYDVHSRLIEAKYPHNKSRTITYDAIGNPLTITEANGVVATNSYDALNQLIQTSYSTGEQYLFDYDPLGNTRSMSNALGTTLITHDKRGLVTAVRDPFNNLTQYGYDPAGNRTQIIYPSSDTVFYSYTATNHLESVTDWLGNITTFDYDPVGRPTSISYPNGTSVSYGYDQASRIDELEWKDDLNNSIYHSKSTFDASDQLTTQELVSSPLIPKVTTPQLQTYTHDDDNVLSSDGVRNYSNDKSGNRTSQTNSSNTRNFSFSGPHILTEYSQGGNTTDLGYDPLGNRLLRTVNGSTTRFALDINRGLPQVLEEQSTSGSRSNSYIYGLGLLARIDSNNVPIYYHFDARGHTIALTDTGSQVVEAYTYDPFGQILDQTGQIDQPYQYLGQYGIQKETADLYFIRARYYDARNGRFLSKDKFPADLSVPQTLNRFPYALNNPLSYVDVDGYKEQAVYDPYYYGGTNAKWQQGTPLWLELTHVGLDVCGLVPALGEACDLVNAGIYLVRGDHINASLSVASAVPIIGWAGTAAKYGRKAAKLSSTSLAIIEGGESGVKAARTGSNFLKFGGNKAVTHFGKHGNSVMSALGKKSYNLTNYLDDANHVIRNGTFVPELNGYVRLIGGQGSAKYGFVGLNRATGNITTFHIKTAKELSKKAPSLGIRF